jgi:hypothetical protein
MRPSVTTRQEIRFHQSCSMVKCGRAMKDFPTPLDLKKIKAYPLAQRRNLSTLDELLTGAADNTGPCPDAMLGRIQECVAKITAARKRGASVMLIYGAHLVKNGLLEVVNALVAGGWVTHLATNGAGTIHDWELAFQGRTAESVRDNVATGTFGTWDETGRNIHLALLAGALRDEGYGRSLGRFIVEDGTTLPTTDELKTSLSAAGDGRVRTPGGPHGSEAPVSGEFHPGASVPAQCSPHGSSRHRLRHHFQPPDV